MQFELYKFSRTDFGRVVRGHGNGTPDVASYARDLMNRVKGAEQIGDRGFNYFVSPQGVAVIFEDRIGTVGVLGAGPTRESIQEVREKIKTGFKPRTFRE